MLDWLEIVTRIGAAACIGGSVGLNRHFHHKAVGLRTLSLVVCGAAGWVVADSACWRGDVACRRHEPRHPGHHDRRRLHRRWRHHARPDCRQDLRPHHGGGRGITAALGALCGIGEWKIITALSAIVAVVLLTGGPIERWCDTLGRSRRPRIRGGVIGNKETPPRCRGGVLKLEKPAGQARGGQCLRAAAKSLARDADSNLTSSPFVGHPQPAWPHRATPGSGPAARKILLSLGLERPGKLAACGHLRSGRADLDGSERNAAC